MRTVDFGAYIVVYNLVIGVLVMISSEKLGVCAGSLNKSHQARLARLTQLSTFTFGAAVATLSAGIYIVFHVLQTGL